MTRWQRIKKRGFDLVVAAAGLALVWPLMLLVAISVKLSSPGPVLFVQNRVGRNGRLFRCAKFRTMYTGLEHHGSVTVAGDRRITPLGSWLRRAKLDELPQIWQVLCGSMSLVGPRPDVPGYADNLTGDDRVVLRLRPGITGPATLAFRNEEALLATVPDPKQYNDTVIWPRKVALNREYYLNWSLRRDLDCILTTIFGKSVPHQK